LQGKFAGKFAGRLQEMVAAAKAGVRTRTDMCACPLQQIVLLRNVAAQQLFY
jgi:hypothetical protein